MITAGFDIATTTGCCILDGSKVVHIEAFVAASETEKKLRADKQDLDGHYEKIDGEIFHSFRVWFRGTLRGHDVEHVAIEQPLITNLEMPNPKRPGETFNPVTFRTYLRLYGLRAHAIEICHALNIPRMEIHQATWRKAFTGSGRATKEQTLKLAQQLVPGLKSKDAAEALGVAWALNGELSKTDLFAEAS